MFMKIFVSFLFSISLLHFICDVRGDESFRINLKKLFSDDESSKKENQSILLTKKFDWIFYGQINIGTPDKIFNVVFDTGSDDFWVLSSNCLYSMCDQHNLYDRSTSSTSVFNGSMISIDYRDGTVKGSMMLDNLKIGTIEIEKIAFAEITSLSSQQFRMAPYDGIFGLGFSNYSSNGFLTVLGHASLQGSFDPVIGMYIDKNTDHETGGELTFGGTNPKYYDGSFVFTPVVTKHGWVIQGNYIEYNMDKIMKNFKALIDSSSPYIIVPEEIFNSIYELFNGELFDGLPIVSCDNHELFYPLTLKFDHFILDVSPTSYVYKITYKSNNFCILGVKKGDFSGLEYQIVLGRSFISAYYTQFDYRAGKIGFAELKPEYH